MGTKKNNACAHQPSALQVTTVTGSALGAFLGESRSISRFRRRADRDQRGSTFGNSAESDPCPSCPPGSFLTREVGPAVLVGLSLSPLSSYTTTIPTMFTITPMTLKVAGVVSFYMSAALVVCITSKSLSRSNFALMAVRRWFLCG